MGETLYSCDCFKLTNCDICYLSEENIATLYRWSLTPWHMQYMVTFVDHLASYIIEYVSLILTVHV